MSASWSLDQLKSELKARKEIAGWIIHRDHIHRRERYFLKDGAALGLDQDRDTRGVSTSIKLLVTRSEPGRQGEVSKKLDAARPLAPQLDSAIAAAQQTDHQAWKLPDAPPSAKDLPEVKSADPKVAEDIESVMNEVTSRIRAVVAKPRQSAFNSAEFFVSIHDRELHLSNGLVHRSSQSRLYAEAAFSIARKEADGSTRSDEYMSTQWSVGLEDLSIERLFEETADRASHALDVVMPKTGRYAVILDAEVLLQLLNSYLSRMSGAHAYQKLPYIEPGQELIPGAKGDLITLILDPSLELGADTVAVSDQGTVQRPLRLVERNQVVAVATDKQYADYLGRSATTVRGSVVIGPGTLSFEELTRQADQVLEILQFSGLFVDPYSGTYSSEIRLARLHSRGADGKTAVQYVKGGSLSGSIAENFKQARFSSEVVRRTLFNSDAPNGQGYCGPGHVLLRDVSIVG